MGILGMFYKLLDNEQFNFQINRVLAYMNKREDIKEIKEISPRIKDFESWIKEWNNLGERAD